MCALPAPLYVAISYHGFGHIAQTAPVVNELTRRVPGLKVMIQCAAPAWILRQHFASEFEHLPEAPDLGMVMADSLEVLPEASYSAYVKLHRQWRERVRREAQRLKELRPALVLANVPYLPLAAAASAGIPSAVIASLNWAEIFYPYCRGKPHAEAICQEMRGTYAQADLVLNPEPSMPMPGLNNTHPIGPIARKGRNRRQEINEYLGLDPHDKLVLLFLGGITTPLAASDWPPLTGVNLILRGTEPLERAGICFLEQTLMPHIDVVCSVDALITKPGYGSFTEAACNGVPVLYVRRGNWPEEPYLVHWLHAQASCLELARKDLDRGEFGESLKELWRQAPKPPVIPAGAVEAADLLESYLQPLRGCMRV